MAHTTLHTRIQRRWATAEEKTLLGLDASASQTLLTWDRRCMR